MVRQIEVDTGRRGGLTSDDQALIKELQRDNRELRQTNKIFQRFLRICAGRTGQIINHSSLASDTGVSPSTVRNWLSLLEASFIIHLVKPHHRNYNKRWVKAPSCTSGIRDWPPH